MYTYICKMVKRLRCFVYVWS